MKILVINGDCITFNSSANLCHPAYIRGLVDSGHDVTLLSSDGKDYKHDESMKIPEAVKRFSYNGMSIYEKLSNLKRGKSVSSQPVINIGEKSDISKKSIKSEIKKRILNFYGIHGIYATFVRKAQKFSSKEKFDYVISLSTPVTSHLIANNLIKAGRIKTEHWIQIW